MVEVKQLCCDAMVNPIGISNRTPELSWIIKTKERDIIQKAYHILLERKSESGDCTVWDSGTVQSQNCCVKIPELIYLSGVRYQWKVWVQDNRDRTWESETAWFETGIVYQEDWQAKWIEPEQIPVMRDVRARFEGEEQKQDKRIKEERMNPCQMLRKEFSVQEKVIRARIYATAHGIYRLLLNGKRVGNYEFAPENTPYNKYLQVQTYDITDLLEEKNVLGVVLGNGWWAGRIGHYGESVQYGDKLASLIQIVIDYKNGDRKIIGSDHTFKSTTGPWRYGEIGIGEKYDMNYEIDNWQQVGYDDSKWKECNEKEYGFDNLTGQDAPHIRVLKELECTKIYDSPRGEKIIDFGQAMAGNATIHFKGTPGTTIILKYFETTDKDGNYWFELEGGNSQQTDTFILGKSGEGTYDPWFTYHGFRYICISSDSHEVEISNVRARLIASDSETTVELHTSDKRIDRLQKNIEWTLHSNMMSVLTDNPDRERAGWTGDLQMIAPTLLYNVDGQAFIRRWLKEAELEQRDDGSIPLVVPNWPHYELMPMKTSAGWGDAVVIVPWILYERYNDKSVLEQSWNMMKKWMAYVEERAENHNPQDLEAWYYNMLNECEKNPTFHHIEISEETLERQRYLWNADYNFGDWLTPSACYDEETGKYTYYTQTLCYLIGSYYYAYSTEIMKKTADILGFDAESRYYEGLNQNIRNAVIEEIYKKGGILESPYMGAQLLALHMKFYPYGEKKKLVERIVELFEKKGMDAGFSSALLIFDELCENGYDNLAYDILLNKEFPSWLYEVEKGATTVWESMQAIMPDESRNAVSFIQPALCSIGNWMVQGMGGIRPLKPGFREILISPYFTDRLKMVKTVYDSKMGRILCQWKTEGTRRQLYVEIPGNTNAKIRLSDAGTIENIKESDRILQSGNGIHKFRYVEKAIEIEVGSGSYYFEYESEVE